mmetsp:Transcript_17314/g.40737  ORF Transcript_17314/g.40737 Transcript_17314/m.40737 type:complete len:102 (+) Transcript_17314:1373-1678(+)
MTEVDFLTLLNWTFSPCASEISHSADASLTLCNTAARSAPAGTLGHTSLPQMDLSGVIARDSTSGGLLGGVQPGCGVVETWPVSVAGVTTLGHTALTLGYA